MKVFAEFGIDAVLATNMTADPEPIPPLSPVAVDGLPTTAYRAYPIVDLVAEVDGVSVSEAVRDAIKSHIESRRADYACQERLAASMERHQRILDRLAS